MEKSLTDILWINISAILVFFMQPGFAMLEAGLTRSKNSINVAMKNLTDLGISSLVYWLVGFALMFGNSQSGIFGSNLFLFHLNSVWDTTFFFFQVVFCSTAATIVSGAVAERMRFSAYLISTLFMSLIIYPISGHWAWGGAYDGISTGWLGKNGFVDFAGSTVVHSVGGWVSLSALLIIGARKDIFDPSTGEIKFTASNIPLAIAGVFVLWFGWFGFNGGSTLAFNNNVPRILINTFLAASSGMIFTLITGYFIKKKFNVEFAINGALGGLVAITANCHAVSSISSLLIGAIGGIITIIFSTILIKLKIDDAVGAIPVHLGAGIWGTIAVALFGKSELLGTGLTFIEQLKIQLIGIFSIGIWSFSTSYIFLYLLNKLIRIRVRPEDEEIGLNYAEHGAKTEGYELLKTIQLQATTGNLSYRVKEEPFSELGVVAHYYNKALDEIQKNVVAKSDYLQILDNIGEGLFLLNSDFSISPAYSKCLEKILEETNLENKNLLDIFQKHVSEKVFKNIKDYLELCFDINIKENVLSNINPLERIEFFFFNENENHSKFLSFKVIRIVEEDIIKRLMLIVKDETQTVILEKEKEKNQLEIQSEMELIYKILHIDYEIFSDFVLDLKKKIITINSILEKNDFESIKESLDLIYRYVHTIKGNARLLELNFIYNKIHKIEDMIEEIRNKPTLSTDDFVPLIIQLSELHNLTKKLDSLIDRLKNFNTETKTNEKTIYSIKRFVDNLSKEHNKKISLITERFNIEIIPKFLRKILNDILIQLVKNSIVHGIEKDRKKIGKNEYGIIELISMEDEENIYISVRDDGQGIDYEKIKEKAIQKNLLKPDEEIAKEKLIEFIFLKSFSTIENTNIDAGRGIGLDIVYE
ncbi:MAG: ammonium transporter, partial [Brevinematales bacterium]|nr:ammonium transporter [Brevinematales bacterium]